MKSEIFIMEANYSMSYLSQTQQEGTSQIIPKDDSPQEDLLKVFKEDALPTHLRAFKKWRKLRQKDIMALRRIVDDTVERRKAESLELYIHSIIPFERFAFSDLMNEAVIGAIRSAHRHLCILV